jgi:hypothetical protein
VLLAARYRLENARAALAVAELELDDLLEAP